MAGGNFTRLGTMLRNGLWDVTPVWMRAMFFAEPPAELLRFDDKKRRVPITSLTTKGDSTKPPVTVDVILPHDKLLQRVIQIPPSPPSKHNAIAELDLLRRTPFAPGDVYWTLPAYTTGNSTQLRQWVAKKTDIAHFRMMLASHGYQVRRFLVASDTGNTTIADFTTAIAPRVPMWRMLNGGLVVAIIGAGLWLWLQPAWQAKAYVDRETIVLERQRNAALDLRAEIAALDQLDSERTAFVNSVMRSPRVVDAIRQLTVALPDDVWAADLLFTPEQITLNGETAQSAANLVLQLTQSNLAYIPALAGPVSRTAEGKERFGIVFTTTGNSE